MKVELVRIGNSRGIRIPKAILRQCRLEDAVELRVEDDQLVITPQHAPREGWEDAFRAAGSAAEDELLLDGLLADEFDRKDWRW